MSKMTFISILLVSTALFISCSPIIHNKVEQAISNEETTVQVNHYGAYLAGRVAHLRKDFDQAADYYKLAYSNDPANRELVDRLYLILTSMGRIEEAVPFAQEAIKNKTGNSFAHMLTASKKMHDGQFEVAIKELSGVKDPFYQALIVPLVNAWNYAGVGKEKESLGELAKLEKEEGLKGICRLHKAMIYDFLGKNREAQALYQEILTDKHSEISVRTLDVITNFYIRTQQKEKAKAMMNATINSQTLDSLLAALRSKVNDADESDTKPVLCSAQVGIAEALFAIASTFRYDETIDVAHMYTALSIYLNPNYNTAKILMADIFETREMFDKADSVYDTIDKEDIAYFAAQLKKARNMIRQGDYKGAEILLEALSDDFENSQIYMELGDILRLNNRFVEAIEYYDKAIAKMKDEKNLWLVYFAKGVALERNGDWDKAEKVLIEANELNRNYLVMNYLGYTWFRQKKNLEQAFEMIVEAYNQAPFDPNVNDSMGFALYNLGYYGMALPYYEKALELVPSSAVISSHLGDAYWFAHRRNEARFQWSHALKLKDDTREVVQKDIERKLKVGVAIEPSLTFDKEKIEETIKKIKKLPNLRRI